MRRAILLVALAAMACGGHSPAAPSAPLPPSYPDMVGGWAGTSGETWTNNGGGSGGLTCNETWLITGQQGGAFSGTYQSTPNAGSACRDAGTIDGTVTPSNEIRIRPHSNTNSGCVLLTGSTEYHGFVSGSGAVTAQSDYSMRCPVPVVGQLDYRVTWTITVNRR
jgi:hypothetical protein